MVLCLAFSCWSASCQSVKHQQSTQLLAHPPSPSERVSGVYTHFHFQSSVARRPSPVVHRRSSIKSPHRLFRLRHSGDEHDSIAHCNDIRWCYSSKATILPPHTAWMGFMSIRFQWPDEFITMIIHRHTTYRVFLRSNVWPWNNGFVIIYIADSRLDWTRLYFQWTGHWNHESHPCHAELCPSEGSHESTNTSSVFAAWLDCLYSLICRVHIICAYRWFCLMFNKRFYLKSDSVPRPPIPSSFLDTFCYFLIHQKHLFGCDCLPFSFRSCTNNDDAPSDIWIYRADPGLWRRYWVHRRRTSYVCRFAFSCSWIWIQSHHQIYMILCVHSQ